MALTHRFIKRVQRPWGWEARAEILDGTTVLEGVTPTWDHNPSDQEIEDRMTFLKERMQERIDYEAARCKYFDDVGPEIKEALHWVVRQIRQYPNATLAQAEDAWNAAWADSLFTWSKLISYIQGRIGEVTWAGFKTYVINHKFEGID